MVKEKTTFSLFDFCKRNHAGDANMNKMELYYPILNVIREESKRYEYKPDTEQNIVVVDEDGNEYARIPMDKFVAESANRNT